MSMSLRTAFIATAFTASLGTASWWPALRLPSRRSRPNGRQEARHGAFRDIVHAGGASALRPRHALSALVLVSRLAKGLRGCAEGRSRMRHRLLGHRAQPVVESPYRAAAEESRRGRRRAGESENVDVKTQRERDYLDALGAMYADYDKVDHRTRLLAYAKAMEQLARRYPDDDEAQIIYALALNTSARRTTRPTPTNSRGRPSWSGSPSASRSIPAWRTT